MLHRASMRRHRPPPPCFCHPPRTTAPHCPCRRAVLNGEKKSVPLHSFPKKSPRAHHVLAVGGWRLVAVGGGWRRLVVGDWWLMAVGSGWRLAVGRRWRFAAVGGWWRLAVGGSWWLAVDGPLGRSLRAVLNKKKTSPLRTPLPCRATPCKTTASTVAQGVPRSLHPSRGTAAAGVSACARCPSIQRK